MRIYLSFVVLGILISAGMLIHKTEPEMHSVIAPPAPTARVLFGGDMMFDRSVRTTIEERGGDYIFSCLDPLFKSANLVVANLEGPITDNPSQSVGSKVGAPDNYIFTFPLTTAGLLSAHNIRVVNLGNNHIMNFGVQGVRTTMDTLAKSNVGYFGDPIDATAHEQRVNGVQLYFINYNEYIRPPGGTSASTTIGEIKRARAEGEIPIVYTHWGVEYVPEAPAYVQKIAHEFIDAGAEIIIGSSPHVVQEHEVYKGKTIYYSLGNLIFDQYFNDAVDHGLTVEVTFTPKGVAGVKEIPVVLQTDRRTCPVS